VPVQLALFWLAALAVAGSTERRQRTSYAVAFTVAGLLWFAGQASLYDGHNTYEPDLARDRASGCAVFGHAELERAGDARVAIARLEAMEPRDCRHAAFSGFGWALVSRYARDGNAPALAGGLTDIDVAELRSEACASARRLLATIYEKAMTPDRRKAGAIFLDAACP
jgi:hypothetical protein